MAALSAPEGRAYAHPHRRLLHKVHLPFRGPWPRASPRATKPGRGSKRTVNRQPPTHPPQGIRIGSMCERQFVGCDRSETSIRSGGVYMREITIAHGCVDFMHPGVCLGVCEMKLLLLL